MIRRARSLDVILPAVVVAAGLGYFGAFLRFGWFLQDEGVLYYHYFRTYAGALPYRDFFTGYGPVTIYLHVALFSLFGVSVEAARVLTAIVNAVSAAGLYAVTRRVAPRGLALVPPVLVLGMQPGDIADMAFHNTPYPLWYAMLFTVFGTWAMLRSFETDRETRRAGWLFLAGVLGGLAFLSKQNAGVFFLWGVTGTLASDPGESRVRANEPLAGRLLRVGYLFLIPLACFLLVRNFLNVVTVTLFVLPAAALAALGARCRFSVVDLRRLATRLGWVALGVVLAIGPWVVFFGWQIGVGGFLKAILFLGAEVDRNLYRPFPAPLPSTLVILAFGALFGAWLWRRGGGGALRRAAVDQRWRNRRRWAGIAAGSVGLVFLVSQARVIGRLVRLEYSLWHVYQVVSLGLDNLAAYLLPVVLGAAIVLAWRQAAGRRGAADPPRRAFLGVLWVGVSAVLLYYPRMDAAHLMAAAAMAYVVAMPLLVLAGERFAAASGGGRRFARLAFHGAWVAVVVFAVAWKTAPKVYSRTMLVKDARGVSLTETPSEELRFDRLQVYFPIYDRAQRVPVDAFRDLIAYLREETAEDEPVFAFPALPMIYFVSDRHNPTRHDYFLGDNVGFEEQVELVRTLERERPSIVVLPSDVNDYFLRKSANFTRLVLAYLGRRYYLEKRLGPYDVWRRYGDAGPTAPGAEKEAAQ